jgi:hypothetical protein
MDWMFGGSPRPSVCTQPRCFLRSSYASWKLLVSNIRFNFMMEGYWIYKLDTQCFLAFVEWNVTRVNCQETCDINQQLLSLFNGWMNLLTSGSMATRGVPKIMFQTRTSLAKATWNEFPLNWDNLICSTFFKINLFLGIVLAQSDSIRQQFWHHLQHHISKNLIVSFASYCLLLKSFYFRIETRPCQNICTCDKNKWKHFSINMAPIGWINMFMLFV